MIRAVTLEISEESIQFLDLLGLYALADGALTVATLQVRNRILQTPDVLWIEQGLLEKPSDHVELPEKFVEDRSATGQNCETELLNGLILQVRQLKLVILVLVLQLLDHSPIDVAET